MRGDSWGANLPPSHPRVDDILPLHVLPPHLLLRPPREPTCRERGTAVSEGECRRLRLLFIGPREDTYEVQGGDFGPSVRLFGSSVRLFGRLEGAREGIA